MADSLLDRLQASLGSAYTLGRELGGGGMSRVFVADETRLGRRVVIKVLDGDLLGGISAERFEREIRLTATLQEPHIVPVLSAGTTADGLPFYVMPYVAGESLRARIREGPLPLAEAVGILRDVARALAHAHRQGVVHRDIKPENVLLSAGTAVVTDFGIAKAITASTAAGEGRGTLTGVGVSLGTPAYMSPEQATGGAVEHATDLYAWGVLAYELLTGAHPFAGRTSAQQLVAAHVTETPSPDPLRRAAVPAPLVAVVMRCLEKEPGRRPASADELLHALDAAAATLVRAPGAAGRVRRRRVLALATAAVAALTVVTFGAGAWDWVRRDARGGTRGDAGGDAIRSIAVLPFENLGGDSADAYLALGLTDALSVTLARLPGIAVAPGASTRALQAQGLTAQDVARRLGVQGVLAGRVRRSGDRLRVVAELVSGADGRQLWADQFDEGRADVFAIEDRLTSAIAVALRPRLTGEAGAAPARERGTDDPEAYDLYRRGRYFWSMRTADGHARAVAYYRQAIARDSTYAAAYGGLADAYLTDYQHAISGRSEAEAAARHRWAAERALALDDASPDARVAYAVSVWWRRDWPGAERELRRALAANPGDARAHDWLSLLLAGAGRLEEAMEESRRAVELDPLAANFTDVYAIHHYLARDYAHAIEQVRKVLEIHRAYPNAHRTLGISLSSQGMHAEAVRAVRQAVALAPARREYLGDLAYVLARSGATQEARALLREASVRPGEAFNIARAWIALGEADSAFAWLERSSWHWPHRALRADPALDPLRADPRFGRLSARIEREMGIE